MLKIDWKKFLIDLITRNSGFNYEELDPGRATMYETISHYRWTYTLSGFSVNDGPTTKENILPLWLATRLVTVLNMTKPKLFSRH